MSSLTATGMLLIGVMLLTFVAGTVSGVLSAEIRQRLGGALIVALAAAVVLGYAIAVLTLPSAQWEATACPGPPYAVC